MKPLVLLCSAALATSAFALQAGDSVTPDAIGKATFVQGTAPAAWEPGKLYFIECWATWCGPCVASIPHVNELHRKYADKGLRVIGLEVFDDGLEKTRAFVKNKGDGMSYPVAYVGRDGAFENDWLKPAGVNAIPHTFLVRDGKLLITAHPGQLNDEIIAGLLSGGEDQAKAIAGINKQKQDRETTNKLFQAIHAAEKNKDAKTMGEKIDELAKFPDSERYLPRLRVDQALIQGDWDAVVTNIGLMKADAVAVMPLAQWAAQFEDPARAPEKVRRTIADKLVAAIGDGPASIHTLVPLCRLQWNLGDKDQALVTARKSAASPDKVPEAARTRFVEAVEKGDPPKLSEFYQWMTSDSKKSKEATH